jgi:hypothetical protein
MWLEAESMNMPEPLRAWCLAPTLFPRAGRMKEGDLAQRRKDRQEEYGTRKWN